LADGLRRAFDADLMARVYERNFEIVVVRPDEVPAVHETAASVGGHWMVAGWDSISVPATTKWRRSRRRAVFTAEFPWDPRHQADRRITSSTSKPGCKKAATHLRA